LLLDSDLIFFIFVVLLASKSCFWPVHVPARSYTSLGQGIKSKTCANPLPDGMNSMIWRSLNDAEGGQCAKSVKKSVAGAHQSITRGRKIFP